MSWGWQEEQEEEAVREQDEEERTTGGPAVNTGRMEGEEEAEKDVMAGVTSRTGVKERGEMERPGEQEVPRRGVPRQASGDIPSISASSPVLPRLFLLVAVILLS